MAQKSKEGRNVPNLRFPGFTEEWVERRLSDLMVFKNGVNAAKDSYGSGYKFINVLDIIENDFITHSNIIGEVNIPEEMFKKNIVKYGDILFQRSSETREEVGQSNVYLDKHNPATFGGFVIRGKKVKEYNPLFLNYLLKTSHSRKEITSKSGGSTRYNIGQETLSNVEILTTSLVEQKKVADFLSLLDEQISTQIKIIENLESLMKGITKKIFSKQIRFKDDTGNKFPDWEAKKLEEIIEKAQSGGTPKSTIKEYYNGEIPFLSISDMTEQGKYLKYTSKKVSESGLENSSSWIVPENSLIYSMYASVGFVSINKIPIATSQAVINIILKENYNLEYVYYYLLNFQCRIHKYIETGTQGNINAQIVKSLPIQLPCAHEQTKIADFLSAFDEKIVKEKYILEQYQQQKKYLLQNLFI